MSVFAWLCLSILAGALGYWFGLKDQDSFKDSEIRRLSNEVIILKRRLDNLAKKPPEFNLNVQPLNDEQKRGT